MRISVSLTIVLLSGAASISACSEELAPPEPDRPTIDSEIFARAMSDLVVARIELLPDTAAYERRTEEILRRRDVSEDDMRTFVQVHGRNDDLMTWVYARLEARLDSLYPTGQPTAEIDTLMGTLTPPDTASGR